MKLAYLAAIPRNLLLFAIGLYRSTSFFRTPSCRFYPSCSKYMAGCVQRFGIARGSILTSIRLLRCHPFNLGGVDEVPEEFKFDGWTAIKERFCTHN
jgi:putative membrane protein insertion efficiency factor